MLFNTASSAAPQIPLEGWEDAGIEPMTVGTWNLQVPGLFTQKSLKFLIIQRMACMSMPTSFLANRSPKNAGTRQFIGRFEVYLHSTLADLFIKIKVHCQ
jgi:hypothetical protein